MVLGRRMNHEWLTISTSFSAFIQWHEAYRREVYHSQRIAQGITEVPFSNNFTWFGDRFDIGKSTIIDLPAVAQTTLLHSNSTFQGLVITHDTHSIA